MDVSKYLERVEDSITICKQPREQNNQKLTDTALNENAKEEEEEQKIVKRVGGNVYKAFKAESIIKEDKVLQIYKDPPYPKRGSLSLLNVQELRRKSNMSAQQPQTGRRDSIPSSTSSVHQPYQRRQSIIISNQKKSTFGRRDIPKEFRRRSTISEGTNIIRGSKKREKQMKEWLPQYHQDALSSLIGQFFEEFVGLENHIITNKEQWLETLLGSL